MLCWFLHGSGRRVSREEEHEVVGKRGMRRLGRCGDGPRGVGDI